jgi:hypothetical protein
MERELQTQIPAEQTIKPSQAIDRQHNLRLQLEQERKTVFILFGLGFVQHGQDWL